MTDTDIAKIRHILENIVTITNTEPHIVSDAVIGELATKVLALLPCSTCNGSTKKPRPSGQRHCRLLMCEDLDRKCEGCPAFIPRISCPDCQQHSS